MLKRSFDIVVALSALVITLPLLCLIVLILRLSGQRRAIYRQNRVGKGGHDFQILKITTMVEGSESQGEKDITLQNDPRVLPVGRWLRKTKLNELPQLFNVLTGSMSLVGWRPLLRRGFEAYPLDVQQELIKHKPGLTGLGSIMFRDEESLLARSASTPRDFYCDEIMPYKGRLELWYLQQQSFWFDLKILAATALSVLFPRREFYLRWFRDMPDSEFSSLRHQPSDVGS